MLQLHKIHHTAIICSDYEKSKRFYTQILGLHIIRETYRQERQSYKLDLSLNGLYAIELFSFPDPPQRLTEPEATGLRHLAFEVENIEEAVQKLHTHGITTTSVQTDEITHKKFIFLFDPDRLPIELYEK